MNIELLQAAFPLGYLAMAGVTTRSGWVCLGAQGARATFLDVDAQALITTTGSGTTVISSALGAKRGARLLLEGFFLPQLDPARDPATWACAKRHLAELVWGAEKAAQLTETEWTHTHPGGSWILGVCDASGYLARGRSLGRKFPDIDTEDPAEAICHAIVSLQT